MGLGIYRRVLFFLFEKVLGGSVSVEHGSKTLVGTFQSVEESAHESLQLVDCVT